MTIMDIFGMICIGGAAAIIGAVAFSMWRELFPKKEPSVNLHFVNTDTTRFHEIYVIRTEGRVVLQHAYGVSFPVIQAIYPGAEIALCETAWKLADHVKKESIRNMEVIL